MTVNIMSLGKICPGERYGESDDTSLFDFIPSTQFSCNNNAIKLNI